MTNIIEIGRFGNWFIKNLAINLIAIKHNLQVFYCKQELFNELGILLYSGTNNYNKKELIHQDNYFDILNSKNINFNLECNIYEGKYYFQTKEIINLIHIYLCKNKKQIIEKNPFKKLYKNNNYIFIHIRLGDAKLLYKPSSDIFIKKIKELNTNDVIFIASDNFYDQIIKDIKKEFKKRVKLVKKDIIKTIQLGSTCKHIILSDGTFSGVIGYLAFYSDVYYKKWEGKWHGEIFDIPNWIEY